MVTKREDQPVDHAAVDSLSPVTVKVGDADPSDEDDDDGEEDSGGQPAVAAPQQQGVQSRQPGSQRQGGSPGRPSKFGQRFKSMNSDLTASRTEIATLKNQIAELRGWVDASRQQGGGAAETVSPQEQQVSGLREQMGLLVQQSANPDLTMEQRQALGSQFQKLDGQLKGIERQMLVEELRTELRKELSQELRQNIPDPQVGQWTQVIMTEFPALTGNKRAAAVAKAHYMELVNENGGEESVGLLREAAAFAYKAYGLGAPRQSRMGRAAMAGAGGVGGGSREDGFDADNFTFTPDDQRVAAGSGVSLREIAASMQRMRNGG